MRLKLPIFLLPLFQILRASKRKRIFLGLLTALLAYTLIGFLILPPIIKHVLVNKLSESLHRQVAIESIRVNPFALSAQVKGVSCLDRDGKTPFFSFESLYINLQAVSIFKQGFVIHEVKLVRPVVAITRTGDHTYNFSDLLETKKGKPSKPFKYSVNNIQVVDGSGRFNDEPDKTVHNITNINLAVPFISDLKYYTDTFVTPAFSAKVNGTPVALKGETKIFSDSLQTSFGINFDRLDIPYYLAYSPVKLKYKIVSGLLSARGSIAYMNYNGKRPPAIKLVGDILLRDFEADGLDGKPLVKLPQSDVKVASSDLAAGKMHLSRVFVGSPEVDAVFAKDGTLNLSVFSSGQPAPENKGPQTGAKEKTGFNIIADSAQVKGGKVNFTDGRGPKIFKTVVGLDEIEVKNYNSAPGSKFGLKAAISTDADEKAGVEGNIGISPLDASGKATLAGLDLKRYAPYYSGMVTFDIRDGKLDMSTDFACTRTGGKLDAKAGNLSAKLTGLKLRQQGGKDDFLSVPLLSVDNASADLGKRKAVLGSLKTEGGLVAVIRDEDGKLNLAGLVKAAPVPKGKSKAAPQVRISEAPWSITVSKGEVKSWAAKVTDLTNEEPVVMALTGITLGASGISTVKGAKGKASLAFKLDKKGAVKLSGPVSLTPFSAGFDVSLKDINITPFQPYFYDRVKVFVTGGRFAAKGRLDIAQQKDGSMKTRYRGGAGVYEFGTVDKEYGDEFVNWKALDLRGMDISVNPLSVRMDEVALADFYSRLILNADGTLNVQSVVEEKEPSQEPKPAPQPQPASNTAADKAPVRIGAVSLQAGRINFTDRSVQPSYTADLTEVTGRVSGLTSEEQKTADVDLRSTFNGFAPLEISGKINPLASDLFVDLKARFTDMELSPVTPYSGKYLGYTIEKGKLSLDVQYKIEKKTLQSSNVIFIDQLNLGDKVKSEKATTLPVKLAVALLKDRNGQIKLDLPVTGRTDDPQFSVGRIILKILVNILVKAATSPFALLGSIFGGGPDLGFVEFGYGSAALSPDDLKKVDTLGKAMFHRPALKLSIEGHVDMDRDREELRKLAFDRKLKAQKLKDTKAGVPVDEVLILPAEYEKYLGKAYGAEKFPKPKNILGLNKSLPPAEMEKLILTNLKITDDDLRGLAQERARKVLAELLKTGKIEPERVFITQGATLQPKPKEGQKNSRVDFSLE